MSQSWISQYSIRYPKKNCLLNSTSSWWIPVAVISGRSTTFLLALFFINGKLLALGLHHFFYRGSLGLIGGRLVLWVNVSEEAFQKIFRLKFTNALAKQFFKIKCLVTVIKHNGNWIGKFYLILGWTQSNSLRVRFEFLTSWMPELYWALMYVSRTQYFLSFFLSVFSDCADQLGQNLRSDETGLQQLGV